MIEFILNNDDVTTDLPTGTTVLDFVRYRQNLKAPRSAAAKATAARARFWSANLSVRTSNTEQ